MADARGMFIRNLYLSAFAGVGVLVVIVTAAQSWLFLREGERYPSISCCRAASA